jgi:acetyltransferase
MTGKISITDRLMIFLSKIFIRLFRTAASYQFFETLLNHFPKQALLVGGKFAMKSFDNSFDGQPTQGNVALVTQSGALKIILLNMMAREGIGLSTFFLCDAMDSKSFDETDYLAKLSEDSETRVILFCIENINRGRKFMDVARKITESKPIIVLKSGKSKAGAKAVLSHTGSLAGDEKIYDSAFKQSHVLRAQTIEEMLDFAKALAFQPRTRGCKVAIITNGGGAGIMAADACSSAGLEVIDLPQVVHDPLGRRVQNFFGIHNPIDLKYSATAETYSKAMQFLLACISIDIIILMVYPSPALDVNDFVDKIAVLCQKSTKSLIVSANGSETFIKLLGRLEEFGIPLYLLPERAVNGAKALAYYGQFAERARISYG